MLEGFDEVEVERVHHLMQILERISQTPFLRNRLAFYGGTCLNFAFFEGIPRLSVDLDFNYRNHDGSTKDQDWSEVDAILKRILGDIGHGEDDLGIQVNYPLKRFFISYERETGGRGQIDLEIGHSRRIPVLANDAQVKFNNPSTQRGITLKAPQAEELFSNKFCTLLYRESEKNQRDLFDVYTFSEMDFDVGLFRSLAIVDSLTRAEPKCPRIYEVDYEDKIDDLTVENTLTDLLRSRRPPEDLAVRVTNFAQKMIDGIDQIQKDVIDAFHDDGQIRVTDLPFGGRLHPQIDQHPALLWALVEEDHISREEAQERSVP